MSRVNNHAGKLNKDLKCGMQIRPQLQVKITQLKCQQDMSPVKYNVVQTMETWEKYEKKMKTMMETQTQTETEMKPTNAVIRNANDAQNRNRSNKQQKETRERILNE